MPREGFEMNRATSPEWRCINKTKWTNHKDFMTYRVKNNISQNSEVISEPYTDGN